MVKWYWRQLNHSLPCLTLSPPNLAFGIMFIFDLKNLKNFNSKITRKLLVQLRNDHNQFWWHDVDVSGQKVFLLYCWCCCCRGRWSWWIWTLSNQSPSSSSASFSSCRKGWGSSSEILWYPWMSGVLVHSALSWRERFCWWCGRSRWRWIDKWIILVWVVKVCMSFVSHSLQSRCKKVLWLAFALSLLCQHSLMRSPMFSLLAHKSSQQILMYEEWRWNVCML